MDATTIDTVERNKALVRRVLERYNAGDLDSFVTALTPDYVRHCQAMPPGFEEIRGPDAMRAFLESNLASFPDYHEEIEMLVAEGDVVAFRSVGSGIQTGPMGRLAPTGRRMSIVIIGMHRFEGGRIAETWTSWDSMTAARQLGFMPAAPGA